MNFLATIRRIFESNEARAKRLATELNAQRQAERAEERVKRRAKREVKAARKVQAKAAYKAEAEAKAIRERRMMSVSNTPQLTDPLSASPKTTRASILVSRDPLGRAIKQTLEHLQQTHPSSEFYYYDLPTIDPDYLAETKRAILLFRMSGGVMLESDDGMARSNILKQLKDAGLVETAGYKTFCLTPEGRVAIVDFVRER